MAIEERERRANCLFFFRPLSLSLGQSAFRECPKAKEYDSHALVTDVQWSNQTIFLVGVATERAEDRPNSALNITSVVPSHARIPTWPMQFKVYASTSGIILHSSMRFNSHVSYLLSSGYNVLLCIVRSKCRVGFPAILAELAATKRAIFSIIRPGRTMTSRR